ncbi:uncharacterized protein LOC122387827 [Amphibalanus amphitrite]|uniref:uncharacterized protein LOC122387827 n=1 Tax=Amphibalanus amphitrite TaxID=1232801 RepID=UPI001C91F185|nr:uncharacterized protein LOC122387827 [Amphibalanus amphitrite]
MDWLGREMDRLFGSEPEPEMVSPGLRRGGSLGDTPSASFQRQERAVRGRGEYLTGRGFSHPLSPTPPLATSSASPSVLGYLRPPQLPQCAPRPPAVFRFPPAPLGAVHSSLPSSLSSREPGASFPRSWDHQEPSQPQSPALTWTSSDSDFPPLSPLSVSSRSPPSPLSLRPRVVPRAERPPRRPAPLLAAGAGPGGDSALFCRRRRRQRSRSKRPGGSPAPKRSGKSACAFCRKNGESKEIVTSHDLRDSSGRVLCPILRSHVCELCHLTGDHAHTRTYCPLAAGGGGGNRPAPSATVQLKSTRHNAAGRRRY